VLGGRYSRGARPRSIGFGMGLARTGMTAERFYPAV
jgi:hypothetical protein